MKKIGIILGLLLASATGLMAQNSSTGYFTKGYLYRHEVNPAFGGEKGYVAFPFLGNMNLGIRGNLSIENFLYNVDGRTTTFMNPKVSTSEALSNISDLNKLIFDMKFQFLSFGFKAFGGYNTFSLNLKTNAAVSVPGDIFRMAKEGIENKSYDLSGLGGSAKAYAELALGHSHEIIEDKLTIGAKVKVLLGGAHASAFFEKANLNLNSEGSWNVDVDAELNASMKGIKYESEYNSDSKRQHITNFDIDSPGVGGFGLAVDLGAEYKINDDLAVSAAILDLGYIKWSNNMQAKSYKNNHFSTDKYNFSVDESDSFDDEMDKLADDLAGLADLQDMGDQGGLTTGIGTSFNVGVEYKLPGYDKLSFGLLNTTRIQKNASWTDFRLSANFAPAKWFSMGANVAYGTFGPSFGWILDLHPTGFGIFVATDHMMGSLSKQMIPLSSNFNLNFGINFPF